MFQFTKRLYILYPFPPPLSLASIFGDRNAAQVSLRWRKALDPTVRKGPWTPGEDDKLLKMVAKHGMDRNWNAISEALPGRLGKQCRERYVNHLAPGVRKGDWTPQEDSTILRLFKEYGTQWKLMTVHLPGRPDNAIKNRFHTLEKRITAGQGANPRRKASAPSPDAFWPMEGKQMDSDVELRRSKRPRRAPKGMEALMDVCMEALMSSPEPSPPASKLDAPITNKIKESVLSQPDADIGGARVHRVYTCGRFIHQSAVLQRKNPRVRFALARRPTHRARRTHFLSEEEEDSGTDAISSIKKRMGKVCHRRDLAIRSIGLHDEYDGQCDMRGIRALSEAAVPIDDAGHPPNTRPFGTSPNSNSEESGLGHLMVPIIHCNSENYGEALSVGCVGVDGDLAAVLACRYPEANHSNGALHDDCQKYGSSAKHQNMYHTQISYGGQENQVQGKKDAPCLGKFGTPLSTRLPFHPNRPTTSNKQSLNDALFVSPRDKSLEWSCWPHSGMSLHGDDATGLTPLSSMWQSVARERPQPFILSPLS